MIEKIIELLTLIVEKLDVIIEQNQNPAGAPAEQPEDDDLLGAAPSKDKETKKKFVLDDVLAAINENVKRLGGDDKAKTKVRGVLEKFDAKRGSEVKEEHFEAVIIALGRLKK